MGSAISPGLWESKSTRQDLMLVINPKSGRGAAKRESLQLINAFRELGMIVDAELSSDLRDATAIARDAALNNKTVVAVGGDGLINAVINGVAPVEDAVMGIIPLGTANDFARALSINQKNAVETIAKGMATPMDLGYAAGRYFGCIASVGFDSMVLESVQRTRLIHGPLMYPYAVLKQLPSWKPTRFTVHTRNGASTFTGFNVAVANTRSYGGGMLLAPNASANDGMFDVVTTQTESKLHFLRFAPLVFSGRHIKSPSVHIERTDWLRVETERPTMFYADGEPLAPSPLELQVAPAAIRVLSPK
jgi:diacylglycerol kinase (ATP)